MGGVTIYMAPHGPLRPIDHINMINTRGPHTASLPHIWQGPMNRLFRKLSLRQPNKSAKSDTTRELSITATKTKTKTKTETKKNQKNQKNQKKKQKKKLPFPAYDLPQEVAEQLLRTILSQEGPSTLISFITAFPRLSKLVLIVSDSKVNPRELIDIPRARTVSLLDFIRDPHDAAHLRSIPIRILSFTALEASDPPSFLLTHFKSCPYGLLMTPETPVFAKAHSTTGLPFTLLYGLIQDCGVRDFFFDLSMSKGYAELDGKHDTILSYTEDTTFKTSKSLTPSMRKKDGQWKFNTSNKITVVDFSSFQMINPLMGFPWLETARVRFQSECYNGDPHVVCSTKTMGLNAPNLKHLYLSFEGASAPLIRDYWMSTTYNPDLFRQYHLVNLDWDYVTAPYGNICDHFGDDVDQASQLSLHCQMDSPKTLTFTKWFRYFNFVGIPDALVLQNDLSNAETIRWKRLANKPNTLNPSSSRMSNGIDVSCVRLKSLHIYNLFHSSAMDSTPTIPFFYCPFLETLNLVALPGSSNIDNNTWDLNLLLNTTGGLTFLKNVHISNLSISNETNPPMILQAMALTPIWQTVVELTIMGYTPQFCLDLQPSTLFQFEMLTHLKIDLSSIARDEEDTISLVFPKVRFPSLKSLCLDLLDDSNISGRCTPQTSVKINELPKKSVQIDINTMITSRIVVLGQELIYKGLVNLEMFTVWMRDDDEGGLFFLEGNAYDRVYREWVYTQ